MDTNTTSEPTYYVNTAFSGVGFLMPGDPVPEGGHVIPAVQVHADVRSQGVAWLTERQVADDAERYSLDKAKAMSLDAVEKQVIERIDQGLPFPASTTGNSVRLLIVRLRDAEARLAAAGL